MCEDQDVPHFIFSHKFGKSSTTSKKTLKNVKTSLNI